MLALADRFWPKVNKTDSCWLWTGSKTCSGYGQIAMRPGPPRLAHRVAWEISVGQIPDGLQVDHLCRNRLCVNPAHMELVGSRTNTLRGVGPTAINARKQVCKRGHSLADAYLSGGSRYCRTCALEKQRLLRTEGHGVMPC
jgi:hypothetical protein